MQPHRTKTMLMLYGVHGEAARSTVINALEAIPGVSEVDVSLYRAEASITHLDACRPADLALAVERSGYRAEIAIGNP